MINMIDKLNKLNKLKEAPVPLTELDEDIRTEYLNWYEGHRRAVEEYNSLKDPENFFLLAWKTRDPVPTAREILGFVSVNPDHLRAMDRYKAWLKEIRKLADDIEPDKPRQDALTALKLGPVMTIEELVKRYRTQQGTMMEYIKWLKQLADLYNQWVALNPPPKFRFSQVERARKKVRTQPVETVKVVANNIKANTNTSTSSQGRSTRNRSANTSSQGRSTRSRSTSTVTSRRKS